MKKNWPFRGSRSNAQRESSTTVAYEVSRTGDNEFKYVSYQRDSRKIYNVSIARTIPLKAAYFVVLAISCTSADSYLRFISHVTERLQCNLLFMISRHRITASSHVDSGNQRAKLRPSRLFVAICINFDSDVLIKWVNTAHYIIS